MAVVGDGQETKRKRAGAVTSTVGQQCWSATFPDDLLAVVYRMIASPRGRMRFAAVCMSWRAAARTVGPLPALPWLLLPPRDGDRKKPMHCPEDGVAVRLQAPSEAEGRWIIGGHDGGWVALPVPGLVRLRIVNLFSGAEVMLPEKKGTMVCPSQHHESRLTVTRSVVFSEPPTSPESILAAITYKCGIALCRLGSPNSGWTVQGCPSKGELINIAFCNGELYGLRYKYGLHYKQTLVKFEIGVNKDGAPIVTAECRLAMQRIDPTIHTGDYKCIFDLQGKVAMAWKTQWLPNIKPFFKVFKLVDIPTSEMQTRYKHKWLEVTSLGDHALFLGETLCKAVHIREDMHSSVERNHIYYSHDYCCLGQNAIIPNDKVFLTISNDSGDHTYYKEDDTKNDVVGDNMKRIGSVGYFMKGRFHGGMWILPQDI